jgi:predicted acetyltransferase
MAGLTGVATAPERRREGLAGRMFEASLAEYRDRGWPISALRPFEEAVYARYGWATGCRYTTATVSPSALAPVREATDGRFRRVQPQGFERLAPVYREWLDGVGLVTRRGEDWWRDRVFHTSRSELYCYAWERDGEARGYLMYDVEDRELTVHEAAHVDGEAYLALLRLLADHDAQVDELTLRGRNHDRLIDVVEDRGSLTVETAPSFMVRIVDVPAALEAVPYPEVEDASLALAVADDHAPWNDGTFRVAVRDGTATVEPTDAAPDARVDVGTLSQLFVGYLPADRARTLGGLDTETEGALDALARLFPPEETYLPERF